jgi:diguanylate cyclase (GGDEF)-like protein
VAGSGLSTLSRRNLVGLPVWQGTPMPELGEIVPKINVFQPLRLAYALAHRWPWFWYVVIATTVSCLVVNLAALALAQEKQRYHERTTEATQSIARLLDQQIASVFDKVDLALQNVHQIYIDQAVAGRLDTASLNASLGREEALLPEISALRIADASGAIRFGSELPQESFVSIGDREYFALARDNPQTKLIVSGPIRSRITQKWILVLARRLDTPEGRFAGVVYANLPCDYFDRVLAVTSLGRDGAATIRMADMSLVYRYPDTKNALGDKTVSPQLRETINRSPSMGGYIAVTRLDGIERSNAYRRVANYPLYVIVGQSTREFLGGWRQNMALTLTLAGMLLSVIWFATLLVMRVQSRLREDIAQRIRIGSALELAIAERGELLNELARKNEALAHTNQTLEQKVAERTAALREANMALEMLARRDALTQVNNRRSVDERLHDEFLRMKRTGISYALLLIDVDHFKEVNDRFGHEQGDHVLQHIARIMVCSCRATDFFGRFGGEEFLVILPGTSVDRAAFVADKMRISVAESPIPGVGRVTISIGVACAQGDDIDEMHALRRADQNLYRAKGNGRNQVVDDTAPLVGAV